MYGDCTRSNIKWDCSSRPHATRDTPTGIMATQDYNPRLDAMYGAPSTSYATQNYSQRLNAIHGAPPRSHATQDYSPRLDATYDASIGPDVFHDIRARSDHIYGEGMMSNRRLEGRTRLKSTCYTLGGGGIGLEPMNMGRPDVCNYNERLDVKNRNSHQSNADMFRLEPRFCQQLDYDHDHTGEITIESLQKLLRDPTFYLNMDNHTIEVLQMKCVDPERHTLSYQELINLMSNKRTPSFRQAVEEQGKEDFQCYNRNSTTLFKRMVRKVAKGYLTDDIDRQYYSDRYSCCPPPVFIPIISLVEVGLFIYHCLEAGAISTNGPIPVESFLIYRPDKRIELWRFLLYMFIHAGWVHLFFNILVQIVVGIPLEMVHGSCRLMAVYMAGVIAGSLGTSVFDMQAYLVGASGGVYALLAAHLANIMLNYAQMEFGLMKLGAVLVVASADVGFAVWDRYSNEDKAPPVGYTAHLMGALAGLTVGLLVLKNFEQKLHEQYIWWIALAVYLGCTVFAVCWNVFYY